MWENLDKTRPESAHYSVMRQQSGIDGMEALRAMFPNAKASELNFVLFSKSDIDYLKQLRASSQKAVNGIGAAIVAPPGMMV